MLRSNPSSLRATDRVVALILASHMDQNGTCFVSVATLSRETALCEASVKKSLKVLCRAGGLFSRTSTTGRIASTFQINPQPVTTQPVTTQPVTTRQPTRHVVTPNPLRGDLALKEEETLEETQEEERTSGPAGPVVQRLVSLVPTNGNGRDTWLTPYVNVWRECYPDGEAPVGPLAKHLSKLDKKHGAGKVAEQLTAYLHTTEIAYVSLPKFASGFGKWKKEQRNVSKALQATVEAGQAFIERHR